MLQISPSILSADFANLHSEIIKLEESGADMIHIDVMDGHFVPNLTFGPDVIKSIRKSTKLPFDVHLMIESPENYINSYVEAGADIITIHPETTKHLDRTISMIKNHNIKAGIALLPTSSPKILEYILDKIDLILVMTVNPGFGGQKFLNNQISKISEISKMIANNNIILSVDGGINNQTAPKVVQAGANMLVSGSYIFQDNYKDRIHLLKKSVFYKKYKLNY